MTISQIAGVLPAVVFPAATAFQLYRMLRARSAAGVSAATWILFGFANVGMYFYAERYTEWQSIVGMLLTAALDFAIAGLAVAANRQTKVIQAYEDAVARVDRQVARNPAGISPPSSPRRPPLRRVTA